MAAKKNRKPTQKASTKQAKSKASKPARAAAARRSAPSAPSRWGRKRPQTRASADAPKSAGKKALRAAASRASKPSAKARPVQAKPKPKPKGKPAPAVAKPKKRTPLAAAPKSKLNGARSKPLFALAKGKAGLSRPLKAAPPASPAPGRGVPGKGEAGKAQPPRPSASPRGAPGKALNGLAKRAIDREVLAGRAVPGASGKGRVGGGGLARVPAGKVQARESLPRIISLPLPLMAPPKRASVEDRSAVIDKRLAQQTDEFRHRYIENFDMSWIYHDSALEGVVYTFDELRTALLGQVQSLTDSSLQPTYDDIRRHKEAIDFVRDFGQKKRLPVTLDVVRKIYLILHPEEGDIKTVKYRKDIPQHRLYFHEYAAPDKIAYKVRQVVDWLNDPETRKTRNGVRIAARAHYDMLRVYPFPTDSGKVARLFMNLLLMRSGLPPAIIHSTERQRYYEALKGSATAVLQMVQEAVENALTSVEKLLDEHDSRKRAFVS